MFQNGPWVKAEDIENETRAIQKLCGRTSHPNIVEVLTIEELLGSPYFFIDNVHDSVPGHPTCSEI